MMNSMTKKEKTLGAILLILAIVLFSANIVSLFFLNQKLDAIDMRLDQELQRMEQLQKNNNEQPSKEAESSK